MIALLETAVFIQLSALTVRWIHFVGLATILGGAIAVALPPTPSIVLARRYEYIFWGAIGLVVVSGIGNVGYLAPSVPEFGSRWGQLFALKLLVVFGLIVMSLVRTGIIVQTLDESPDRRWYALTALWTILLVAIAVVMVRG